MQNSIIKKTDPVVYQLIQSEKKRQQETLMMIPSENHASKAVEEAMSSSFGNKYAEGYPGRRYYQGNEFADQIEQLCIDRAKKLFHVPFVNVQAHSGSPANFAVELALLQPGETFMGLSLSSGGHLTHGARFTAGTKFFKAIQYDVKPDGYLDYDQIEKLAIQHRPKLIIAGTTAYPRIIDWKKFRAIADTVGAVLHADISHISGLIVAGAYPSPVPYADIIMTTTHKSLRGPRGAMIMVTDLGLKKDPDLGKKINSAIIPGIQGGPHLNSIAALAVALKEASTARFTSYGKQIVVNAVTLAEELKKHNFKLITGGTDSHLILTDMTPFGLLGNTMAEGCEAAGIVLNRNGVPFDPNPPFYPSGIRLGTPGITSRGMKPKQMKLIGGWLGNIASDLSKIANLSKQTSLTQKDPAVRAAIIRKSQVIKKIKIAVKALCKSYPVPELYT
ncbi:MAG: serine hydroxymethyltransferase [Candidatus Roizmanbacteria bacterium]